MSELFGQDGRMAGTTYCKALCVVTRSLDFKIQKASIQGSSII